MKLQIKEFAVLTGVSVRTLHYYDEIGLLKPSFVDEQNGYRFYDETSLERMQEILFYRELDFSLKSIGEILASPNYDKQKAFAEQKITVAMNEITGNAGIGHRFDRCRHLAMEWVGIVVANPRFKQIAKNIQRVGLASFPR